MDFIAAALSIFGGIKAKDEAKDMAASEAGMEVELTNAKLEDLKIEERNMRGQTIARTAGSNVKVDIGSPLEILAEQARNFTRERQTVAKVGATRAANTIQRGKNVGRQALYQGWSTGLTQASSAMKSAFGMGG